MLESLPVILVVSTLLGFLSGLGIGGGSLLILWLTLVLKMDHTAARALNLLFFIPSALVACLFRWHRGDLNWKSVLPAVISGCIAAFCFSLLSANMNLDLLKRLFGGLLILTGLREIFFKQKKPSS